MNNVNLGLIYTSNKGCLQLKILVVFTTKTNPPAGRFRISKKKSQNCLLVGRTPVKKITKDLVVGPNPPLILQKKIISIYIKIVKKNY